MTNGLNINLNLMKKQILLAGALCASMLASAENIDVKSFRYVGPYQVHQPYLVDMWMLIPRHLP